MLILPPVIPAHFPSPPPLRGRGQRPAVLGRPRVRGSRLLERAFCCFPLLHDFISLFPVLLPLIPTLSPEGAGERESDRASW